MTSSDNAYYQDLYASDDDARRAGWRHRLEQALRYEVALRLLGEQRLADMRMLDVGCGPGGLLCYLQDTGRSPRSYMGIDPLEEAIARARARLLDGHFRQCALEELGVVDDVDAAVAIGALIDGVGITSERMRRQRIAAFLEHLLATGCERGVLILLEQGALDARPSLAMESALFGLHHHETDAFTSSFASRHANIVFTAHAGFLPTDLAITWRPEGEEAMVSDELATACLNAVIEGPWSEDVEPSWRAWLCIEAGAHERAREILAVLDETPHVSLLRERLELIS